MKYINPSKRELSSFIDRPYARNQILYMRGYVKPNAYHLKYQIIYDKIRDLKENLDIAFEGGQHNISGYASSLEMLCDGKV